MTKDIVGGQAIMEGVMMINKRDIGIAVRAPDKKIVTKKDKISKLPKIFELPFIRGFIKIFFMLFIGIKALNYSVDVALSEEHEKTSTWEIVLMIAFSVVIAILAFKLLPLFLANVINTKLHGTYTAFNILDGIIKISLFIGYVYAISFLKDVRRLFEYHGAEHMAVHCYEAKKKLTVSNVKKFTTLHPRCGTAFIMIVLIISIIIYTFIPEGSSLWFKFGLRILLLPVIAGVSYEFLRLGAKYE
ncbi:MAG: DUF1385 domain-containing protein, partial [Minisyncoccales bacterium]